MILKPIEIEDLDGNPLIRDYAFHMNASEALEFAHRYDPEGDIERYFKNSTNTQHSIFDMIKDLLSSTVGKRHEDNVRFVKTDEIKADFVESGAYDAVLMEFAGSADKMIEFFNGVLPKNVLAKAQAIQDKKDAAAKEPKKEYTIAELTAMPYGEFQAAVGDDPSKMTPEVMKLAWTRRPPVVATI